MKKSNKKLFNSTIVNFSTAIHDAIEKLEKSHKKILFVTNKNKLQYSVNTLHETSCLYILYFHNLE